MLEFSCDKVKGAAFKDFEFVCEVVCRARMVHPMGTLAVKVARPLSSSSAETDVGTANHCCGKCVVVQRLQ